MTYLFLTVRFLDDRYHGLLDRGGPPEWPPSPFRLFQALVAGVARRGELVVGDDVPTNTNFTPIGQALDWLQRHTHDKPPTIIAPKSKTGQAITRFVPNNDGDKKFDRQERLTAKHTQPTLFLLEPNQKSEVHYVWDITGKNDCPINNIERAARSLTTLGWGIDMAFANAQLADVSKLNRLLELDSQCSSETSNPRKRKWTVWYPKKNVGSFHDTLRMPTYDVEMGECTLCDLRHCHSTFINRIEDGKPLKTVDKPKVFDRVMYTSVERPESKPFVLFKLLDENEGVYRHSHACLIHIAGMVRHLAIQAMKKNPPPWIENTDDWVCCVIRGKQSESSQREHQQFSYIPIPSIGHTHADAMIRNVMVVAPWGMERELDHLAERLNGQPLEPEGEWELCDSESKPDVQQRVELRRFTPLHGKFIDTEYLGTSRVWYSVTPVILDGHNDKKQEKTIKLIQIALQRAGIETPCQFTWQAVPFLKNCLSAHKYDRDGRHTGYHRPSHLKNQTAVHVRLTFDSPVPGPIALGAGRHCGFGLMATLHKENGD